MAQFNQNDFETTLLNKAELEQALGIKINLNNSTTHLDDYAMYSEINLHDVVCIFLDLHPEDWNAHEHPRYNTIFNAIKQSAETGNITARIEKDRNGFNQIFLNHDTIRRYAQTYNLLWNVPPYKAVEINTQTADNSELIQQLTSKDEEIARLKAEIESLKQAQMQKTQIVDYEQRSIYGHTTEPIKAIFDVINRFWVNADLSQPDTIANAEHIEKWIEDNFDNVKVSKTIREAIQKITRPEQARYIGRKS
ncbi:MULTISPECIES: hypothetical protein [Mannheimia]|uniref:Uncharacterized protein n=1 Tax=Mannheimia pernigra TaxID=111844 RepID=A0ABD7A778_9PAST|nr:MULTISPECIES: hypothetical protein [Mannheimia]QLB42027.1 hypothetical protein HV560_03900 [Mannheimia pernigra]QTM00740.1 hypothetical protein GM698_03525 [Mannheimia sp. ZY171111]